MLNKIINGMKTNFRQRFVFFLILSLFYIGVSKAQKTNPIDASKWTSSLAFIENQGQFDGRNWQSNSHIDYAIAHNGLSVFFTKEGLTYRFDDIVKVAKEEDEHETRRTNLSELLQITWVGANEDVEIIAEDLQTSYYSYAIEDKVSGEVRNVNNVRAYKKLTYKNLYDNIDVEYEIHEGQGIKYTLFLHPGADLSQVKMQYSSSQTDRGSEFVEYSLDSEGDIQIKTSLGSIIEKDLKTFYKNGTPITSNYVFENDILSFNLADYDHSQEVVIDPWIISATFNTSTAVWEVETDASDNVYVIGGETPMALQKYNSTGTLQWTYNTPWDTASVWIGTLATDEFGNSFITAGTSPEIERISPAGAMVWHNPGYSAVCEYWSITFNCDNTRLIVGGTYVPSLFSFDYSSAIFDIDINNGNVLGFQTFDTTDISIMFNMPVEVRSICASKDARYLFLTHTDVGEVNQNIGLCPTSVPVFKVPNGYQLAYKCEDYLPETQNGGGLKAIIANDDYVYIHRGDRIYKRSLVNGALISDVAIPGGSSSTDVFGNYIVTNSGLDVDSCGNVYAGSVGQVIKFNEDLVVLSTTAVGFTVYDVSVNSNGEVLAVGAVSNNSNVNRSGKIQSLNLSACAQYEPNCCDAHICSVPSLCDYDAAFNLTSSVTGGVWSGTGITNTSLGTFDPSVSGIGSFWVHYTLPCGSDSILVVVNLCTPITVCSNGTDYVATGGSSSLTWSDWETYNTPINNEAECIACPTTTPNYIMGIYTGCSSNTCSGTGWVNIGAGNTLNPSLIINWPIIVTDGTDTTTYNNAGEIPACSSSPLVADAGSDKFMCEGDSLSIGGAPSALGGTTPYTYFWTPSTGMSNNTDPNPMVSPTSTTQYILLVTDSLGNSDLDTVLVTVYPLPNVDLGPPLFLCIGDTDTLDAGAGMASYLWTGGASTQTLEVTTSGTYYVTVTSSNGCTTIDSIVVTVAPQPTATINGDTVICEGDIAMLVADGGGLYDWNTGQTNDTIYVSPTSTIQYYVIVSVGSCVDTAYHTVTVLPSPNVDLGPDQSLCEGDTATLDAGLGFLSYLWSTSETSQTINVLTGGTYYVTVNDTGSCPGIDSVIIIFDTIPIAYILGDTAMCYGDSVVLTGYGGGAYLWSTSSTQNSITVSPLSNSTYTLTVSNGSCTDVASYTVTVYPLPNVYAGNDTTITAGSSVQLLATGGVYYTWSPIWYLSCIDCPDPVCTPDVTTVYTVTVTDANGCSNTDDVIVYVEYNCVDIFVPTAFAPNGNNYNDYFHVLGGCFSTFNMKIFDRWGNKIFESNDQEDGWDGSYKGEPMDGGIYYYIYSGMRIDGETDSGNGNITLIR